MDSPTRQARGPLDETTGPSPGEEGETMAKPDPAATREALREAIRARLKGVRTGATPAAGTRERRGNLAFKPAEPRPAPEQEADPEAAAAAEPTPMADTEAAPVETLAAPIPAEDLTEVLAPAAEPEAETPAADAASDAPLPAITADDDADDDSVAPQPPAESAQRSPDKRNESLDTGEIAAQLAELLKEAGKPLTAEGELLERPLEQREIMVLFESGLFLVSRSHLTDPYVLKLESYARLRGIKIERKLGVPLDIIKEAYVRSGADSTKPSTTQMQKDILRLIEDAVHENASDIHIITEQNRCIVEMRLNGVLRQRLEWRGEYGSDFCAACFAMADASDANYNPNEYQAARISRTSADLPDTVQALRLQFNPLAYGGRYLIMRLLYRGSSEERSKARGNVQALGYTPTQFAVIRKMIATPVGIGVISGPTGSGKSTTLFHVLSTVLEECKYERNVITIEDPPERPIFGAKQMPVTNAQTPEERSRKFIQAISAAMRSDPDTIMIGEVRDKQSGKLAIEAAMTGHQVWTTVHANDALMIVNRLRDIGVEEYNLFTPGMIFGLIGQRLARSLCEGCRIPLVQSYDSGRIPEDIWQRLCTVIDPYQEHGAYDVGDGCELCGAKKGYSGRTVVAEVLYPDEELMQLLRDDNRSGARQYWLKEMQGVSMMQHALEKLRQGILPPAEIERVVGPIEPDFPEMARDLAAE